MTDTAASTATTGHVFSGEGLDLGTLTLMLEALDDFVGAALTPERQLELDHEDVCPEDIVRAMCSDELGVQLVFVPEADTKPFEQIQIDRRRPAAGQVVDLAIDTSPVAGVVDVKVDA